MTEDRWQIIVPDLTQSKVDASLRILRIIAQLPNIKIHKAAIVPLNQKPPWERGLSKEVTMGKHRCPNLMQSRVATLLSIMRTIVELTIAIVKLWQSM